MEQIRRALLCPHCESMHILQAQNKCKITPCTCDERIRLDTIFDLYALLYFLLNNRNYNDFETLVTEEHGLYQEIFDALEEEWDAHKGERQLHYTSLASWDLLPETIRLFDASLEQAGDKERLLLTLFGWLFLLDEKLEVLRRSLWINLEGAAITTVRGPLLYRELSELNVLLENQKKYKAPHNANLELRKSVRYFYLAHPEYDSYSVVHRKFSMRRYSSQELAQLKFCFVPGDFDLNAEYAIQYFEEAPDWKGRIPFLFTGLHNSDAYASLILGQLEDLLNKDNPHFILLPELFAPLELQREMAELMRRTSQTRQSAQEVHRLQLFGTGSFHASRKLILEDEGCEHPERIYNYAQVTDGEGVKVIDIYKMNRFEVRRGADRIEVEKNAYDQREIVFLETPIGRMVFLICVDFIQYKLMDVLADREVRWIFVMSMTKNPSGGKFRRQMHELGERTQAVVMLCNNLGLKEKPDDPAWREHRTVVYLPGFKATFVDSNGVLSASLKHLIDAIIELQKD